MSVRPRLKPRCRRVTRPDGTLHLGPDPEVGIRIAGLTEPERSLLELVDGALDEAQLITEGRRRGVPEDRTTALLRLLAAHHVTVSSPAGRWDFAGIPEPARDAFAPDAAALSWLAPGDGDGYAALADRRDRRVAVLGRGPVTGQLAALLLRAGLGRVEYGAYAAEALEWPATGLTTGPTTGPITGRRTGRRTGGGASGAAQSPPAGQPVRARARPTMWPDLVVLVAEDPVHPDDAHPWLQRGVAHLPVTVGAITAVVGPLVVPGGTPCLRCVERTRDAVDPGRSAPRRTGPGPALGPGPVVRAEASLAAVTTGLVAMVALGFVDGRPGPVGMSLHVELPWPAVRQRRWQVHPGCACRLASATASGPTPEALSPSAS